MQENPLPGPRRALITPFGEGPNTEPRPEGVEHWGVADHLKYVLPVIGSVYFDHLELFWWTTLHCLLTDGNLFLLAAEWLVC